MFMFTPCLMVIPIAMHRVHILILTVHRNKTIHFDLNIFLRLDKTHGPRTAPITGRHVGDLGNVTTDANGRVALDISDSIIQLYNATQSILNRTIVIHLARDDGGMGNFSDSLTTGYELIFTNN